MIPSLIKLLEDEDDGVKLKAGEVIDNLAHHGEWQLDSITAQLT